MAKAAANKALTKSQTFTSLAESVEGLSKKQVASLMEALANLAYNLLRFTWLEGRTAPA